MLAGQNTRLVTPDAVVLQFETAGLGSRFLAFVIDGVVQATLLLIVLFATLAAGPSTAALVVVLVAQFLVVLCYHPLWEILNRGRSLGKMALGLRVVTREGGAIRVRHALLRGLLWLVDVGLTQGVAGAISIMATKQNQRLGDMVAGTLVVRERSGAGRVAAPMTFAAPRGFESFTANLDVSRMTAGDYEAVRSYATRRRDLRPEVRDQIARSLARPLAARLGHAPPQQLDADIYLGCLLAAYQARVQPTAPVPAPEPPAGPRPAPPPPQPPAPPPPVQDFTPPS